MAQSTDFCERCRSIDFESISKLRICHGLGVHVLDLEATYEELEASSCSLCRLFGAAGYSNLLTKCQLRAFSAKATLAGRNWGDLIPIQDSVLLGVEPLRIENHLVAESQYLIMLESLRKTGLIALNRTARSVPHTSFQYRPIAAHRFDAEWSKQYIEYCQQHHPVGCAIEPAISLNLRVIDCKLRKVEMAHPGCKYVALSYVWGSPSSSDSPGCVANQALPTTIPRTIRDSIDVTLALGYDYLWIDKYCINQDDNLDKHDQVSRMDEIYSRAQVTIVAAAGEDASYGLPGVGERLRKSQPIVEIHGFNLFAVGPHPRNLVRESRWASRGWTYQEGILSMRRLIFTDQKVFYDCNGMHGAECLRLPLDQMHQSSKPPIPEGFEYGIPEGFAHGVPTGPLAYKTPAKEDDSWNILVYIDDFNQRTLTFESDRLEALQGIFQVFSAKAWPVGVFMGIPILFPHKPKSPSLGYGMADIKQLRSYSPLGSFIDGLTWHHRGTNIPQIWDRRPNFPSWSWAGWSGSIAHRPLLSKGFTGRAYRNGQDNPSLWIETPEKAFLPVKHSWNELLDMLSLYSMTTTFLHIESETFECEILYLDSNNVSFLQQSSRWPAPITTGWHVRFPIVLPSDGPTYDCGRKEYFYARCSPHFRGTGTVPTTCLAISLSSLGQITFLHLGSFCMLLVEQQVDGQCWERVGLVQMDTHRAVVKLRETGSSVRRRLRLG